MHFKTVRVRNFRNIVDSGVIEVDDITCLVGMNEAGKTSLLQAIYRIKPHVKAEFRPQDDYPRWL